MKIAKFNGVNFVNLGQITNSDIMKLEFPGDNLRRYVTKFIVMFLLSNQIVRTSWYNGEKRIYFLQK